MKLTPRYDYYLVIDGRFIPLQIKVWEFGGKFFWKKFISRCIRKWKAEDFGRADI